MPGDEDLYDCTIYCGDGSRVHANTFVMTQNCKVLANAFDCERDRRDFHVERLSLETMRRIVDILHKKVRIASLDLTALQEVMEGFDYLDCRFRYKRIIERLWVLCRSVADVETMYRHADLFIHSDEHRLDFLLKMRLLTPTWTRFREVFTHVRMNEKCAVFCLQHLMLYFPAVLVFNALVSACPASLQQDIASKLLGLYRVGVYFHPAEYAMAMKRLVDVAPARDLPIIRNCVESNQMYASSASKLHATFLSYTNSPKSSILIQVLDPFAGQRRVKIPGVADLTLNNTLGTVTGSLFMYRMSQHIPIALNTVYVRITAYVSTTSVDDDVVESEYDIAEGWRTYEDADHAGRGEVELGAPAQVPYDETHLTQHLKNPRVRYIRMDVFWAKDPRSSVHF